MGGWRTHVSLMNESQMSAKPWCTAAMPWYGGFSPHQPQTHTCVRYRVQGVGQPKTRAQQALDTGPPSRPSVVYVYHSIVLVSRLCAALLRPGAFTVPRPVSQA